MIVVTAFTPSYAALAERLELSCGVWEVPYKGVAFPDLGNWQRNNAFKPTAILANMDGTGDDVLWLDADCELIAKPALPDCDVGFVRSGTPQSGIPIEREVFDFHQGCRVPNINQVLTPWGGFMYFANTPQTLALLHTWRYLCDLYGEVTSDEQCMLHALRSHTGLREGTFNWRAWCKHTPAGTQHGKPGVDTWL